MNVIIGADHRGYVLKEKLKEWLDKKKYTVVDVGPKELVLDDDYVDYGTAVIKQMKAGDRGILLCGSGHGMELVANRHKQVRAILGFNEKVVVQGRKHENANVLSLPSDWVSLKQARNMVELFVKTKFDGETRHKRRLRKISELKLDDK